MCSYSARKSELWDRNSQLQEKSQSCEIKSRNCLALFFIQWQKRALIGSSSVNGCHQNPNSWLKQSKIVQNSSKLNILVETLCEKTTEDLFPLKEALFSIMGSYFSQKQWFEAKNILMMDLFLTNGQLLTSQDNTLIYGQITCGLSWCLFKLFGLSYWRHPFTAEDPLVSKWCNSEFLQNIWLNKLITIPLSNSTQSRVYPVISECDLIIIATRRTLKRYCNDTVLILFSRVIFNTIYNCDKRIF